MSKTPRLSVVVATYNRVPLLERLLEQLATQTLPPGDFEVVVVDDGSKTPAAPHFEAKHYPFRLTVITQANAGAAAARHRGVMQACGEVVLITDDDMQVASDFLERHLAHHTEGSRKVVLGRIKADPSVSDMPLFERWYAYLNDKMADELSRGDVAPTGSSLFTGNVSMRRADYVGVGGFDASLGRSEDVELGLKLEAAGCTFEFAPEAYVLHGSDHTSFEVWLGRAFRYGIFDSRISEKHPEAPHASPWRFLFNINPLARPLLVSALCLPRLTKPVSQAAMEVTRKLDKLGFERAAFAGATVVYSMEYYRGVRSEAGNLVDVYQGLSKYLRGRGRS